MEDVFIQTKTVVPDLDTFMIELSREIEKRDLERIMKENENGN